MKRKRLMERGFTAPDLLITIMLRKPDGEGSAVLTLRASAAISFSTI